MIMPTCTTCNDTHQMEIRDRIVLCTRCPRPCRQCARDNGRGAYCEVAACGCPCHRGVPAPTVKPCQWCGKETTNSNACDPCWEIQRQVMNAPRAILRAIVERCAPSIAAELRRAGFDIARDNVTAKLCDSGAHVELDWTGAEAELERTNKAGL